MVTKAFSIEDGNLSTKSITTTRQLTFTDIDLTFTAKPSGEIYKKTDAAAVKQAIKNLLLTNKMEKPQLNIDFANTTPIEGFDGGKLFGQAVIIRKISKFIVGADEDMLIPIPVFYDLESKKILSDSLPKELRDEYKDITLDV